MTDTLPVAPDALRDQLLEAWRTNNRINRIIIEAASEEGLRSSLSTRGGRDVARQFAHIHNNRVWQLEGRAKDLAAGLPKFASRVSPTKDELTAALDASCEAIGRFLEDVLNGVPKRRGFRKGIFATLGYLIAHESHHRGSILLTMKTSGHSLDKAIRDGIWGWDQI